MKATWAWTVFHFLSFAFNVKLHLQFTTPHFFASCTHSAPFIHSRLVSLIYHKVGFRALLIRSNWPSQLTRMTFFPLKKSKSTLDGKQFFPPNFFPSINGQASAQKTQASFLSISSHFNFTMLIEREEKVFVFFTFLQSAFFFVRLSEEIRLMLFDDEMEFVEEGGLFESDVTQAVNLQRFQSLQVLCKLCRSFERLLQTTKLKKPSKLEQTFETLPIPSKL